MDRPDTVKRSRPQRTITFQPAPFVASQLPKAMKRMGLQNQSRVINHFLIMGISQALNGK